MRFRKQYQMRELTYRLSFLAPWRMTTKRVCFAAPCQLLVVLNGCAPHATERAVPAGAEAPGSHVWHFRFVGAVMHNYTYVADPTNEFGDLTVDAATLRFTYQLWSPLQTAASQAALGTPVENRRLLSVAAGFDGKNYWTARFEKPADGLMRWRRASWQAGGITLFVVDGEEVDAAGFQERFPSGDSFYMDAPLHGLLGEGKFCWDAESIRAILDHHPDVTRADHLDDQFSYLVDGSSLRELSPSSLYVKLGASVDRPRPKLDYRNPWSGWSAVFAIDEHEPCVRAVYAVGPMWSGLWIYPTPSNFFILRDDEPDVQSLARFEFGYQKYMDTETRVDTIQTNSSGDEAENASN